MAHSKPVSKAYLQSLLNRTLRVTTSDTRMFLGDFKCTDSDRNIILAHTHEYRMPSASSKAVKSSEGKVVKNMTSRYLGLVVLPGEYIMKIELEQFISQVSGNKVNVLRSSD